MEGNPENPMNIILNNFDNNSNEQTQANMNGNGLKGQPSAGSGGVKKKMSSRLVMEKLQETFQNMEGETISLVNPIRKRIIGGGSSRSKASHWELKGFRNPVRQDQLVLEHWVKVPSTEGGSGGEESNKYTKYNKKMEILMYTDEEYENNLKEDGWTREETNQLMELCKRFDTRFIVISDRFESTGAKKTTEDLKERYYRIQSKLMEIRWRPEEDPYRNPYAAYQYNKIYETERKAHAECLSRLSKPLVQEEQMLHQHYLNIEKHLIRHSRESKIILKKSQQIISNGPLKHHPGHHTSSGSSSGNIGTSGSDSSNRKKRKHQDISSTNEEGATVISRVDSSLMELEVSSTPSHPVGKSLLGDLKEDIQILLDLQKLFLEKRYHCEMIKSQKKYLESEIENLMSTIPPEALNLHVDEENETIQNNLTSDSEQQIPQQLQPQQHSQPPPSSKLSKSSSSTPITHSTNATIENITSHHQNSTTVEGSVSSSQKSSKSSSSQLSSSSSSVKQKDTPELSKEEKRALREKAKLERQEKKLKRQQLQQQQQQQHSNQSTPSSLNTPQLITSTTTIQPMNIDYVPQLNLNPSSTTVSMISPALSHSNIAQQHQLPTTPNVSVNLSPKKSKSPKKEKKKTASGSSSTNINTSTSTK